MIDYIRGSLKMVETPYIVVETSGIGYQIHSPNPFVFQNDINHTVVVYTYQYVREDVIRLYGFKTRKERSIFEKLLNVSGIGPKGALAILASGQPEQLIQAIEEENEQFLIKFPGVGKKTARQIILDLKGKLGEFLPSFLESNGIMATVQVNQKYPDALSEAIEALKSLGYVEKEIKKILPELSKEELHTDEYIKKALQLLFR